MDLPTVFSIINICADLLGIAGAVLIIYGGFRAIVRVLLREISKTAYTYNQIRRDFTDKIVFGLEFLIAADILANTAGSHQSRGSRGHPDDPWLFPLKRSSGI
jgi:uncharacterized membrane protein